jgi:hypothetical protein
MIHLALLPGLIKISIPAAGRCEGFAVEKQDERKSEQDHKE